MYRTSRLYSAFLFLVLVTTLLVISDQAARAGDQDGIAGYKFKIYDSDGDGIDGNEPNNGTVSGSSVTTSGGALRTEDKSSASALVVTIQLVRHWLIWLR